MTSSKRILRVVPILVAVVSFSVCPAQATKPDKPGGGSGKGGGKSSESRFSVIEIPIENGLATLISDADANDVITVAIDAPDAGYGSGAFAKVDRSTGTVLDYGFLPEPAWVDPNGTVYENGWSGAYAVNTAGVIAGYSATFHPELGPGSFLPTLWTQSEAGYSRFSLPLPAGTTNAQAYGINTVGDVVGTASMPNGPIYDGTATFWDAESLEPVDLNTAATAALGWNLKIATGINDNGLISGVGQIDGVDRGFILDRASQEIWAVPLLAPGVANQTQTINAQGRVVGSMWDGDAQAYGLDPDFHSAYYWDGPVSDPQFLPSLTDNTSAALGLNDAGTTVGFSIIPTDDFFADDTIATLWEPDADGVMQALNLRDAIPNKPEYRLDNAFDVNNDGWISVSSRKFHKGQYSWPTTLLMPNVSATSASIANAVPEPSSTVLAILCLAPIVLGRRRSNRAATAHALLRR